MKTSGSDRQILSAEEMANQQYLGAVGIGEALGKKFRVESMACQVVRKMLTDFETVTVQ